MKRVSILGSTGSIGTQTLEVVAAFPDQFEVIGLAAGNNIECLKKQITVVQPRYVSVKTDPAYAELTAFVKERRLACEVLMGEEGLLRIATHPDTDLLIVAIVGTTALKPTYDAICAGIPIALACKEVLVSAGHLMMTTAKAHKVPVLPIDSEHAAIHQCLAGIQFDIAQVRRMILTASGGPFWNRSKETFGEITREQALKHPNWAMGGKITIDSATLFNKGLEVIEAHHLFAIPFDQLDVIIHPQSIIHSLVEMTDGNILAHLGPPDMRFPIQYALSYPTKWAAPWPKLNLANLQNLQFIEPDTNKFPMLKLALEVGRKGGTAPAVMNAANEAAVGLFLEKKIGFMDIYAQVLQALETEDLGIANPVLGDIIKIDQTIKEKIRYAYAG